MYYLCSAVAGLIAGIAILLLIRNSQNQRKRRKGRTTRKPEFSKLVLSGVLLTYFIGFGVGFWVVIIDVSQLGVFLTYIGAPTATAIGFYSWKAKAENVVKIKKANPEATEGMSIDLNSIQP